MAQPSPAIQAIHLVQALADRRNKVHQPPVAWREEAPGKEGTPNWLTFCPAHDDVNNPSLHVTFHDKLLYHCRTGCTQVQVTAALMNLGFLKPAVTKTKVTVNVPAHAEAPEEFIRSVTLTDEGAVADTWYSYRTAENRPAFWVLRNSTPPKAIKPLSSVTDPDTGAQFFAAIAYPAPRPLYNLPWLLGDIGRKVLVVEGEATAEAARGHFPGHTVTTWAGGASAVHLTAWEPLRGRDVVLCPDNDKAGIAAMEQIAKRLFGFDRKARVSMTFRQVRPDLGVGWDVGDAPPGDDRPAEIYHGAVRLEAGDLGGSIVMDVTAAMADLDARLVPLQLGGDVFAVDHTRPGRGQHPLIPYANYALGSVACRVRENVRVLLPGSRKEHLAIDLWAMGIADKTLDQFGYYPQTTDKFVEVDGVKALNTFRGFPHAPRPGSRHEVFLTHLDLLLELGQEYVLDWLAHMIQHPEVKPGTFLLIKGRHQGTGKSALGDLFRHTIGEANSTAITPANFKSDFNGYMSSKLFLYIDEFSLSLQSNRKQAEEVRSLITSESVQINEKGVKLHHEKSYLRMMGTTNSDVPYHMDLDARRDTVLEARNHAFVQDPEYFNRLYAAMHDPETMANWMAFLLERVIVNDVRRAYRTSARERMTMPSSPVTAFVYDILCSGELPPVFANINLKGQEAHPEVGKWPGAECYLPRALVNEWLAERYRIEGTMYSITQRMRELLGDEGLPEKKMRFDVWKDRNMSQASYTVYRFRPLHIMRACFEAAQGRTVSWPAGPVGEDETNVVRMADGGF